MSVGTDQSIDSVELADLLLRASVEAFQNREIVLLQDGRYEDWLDLVLQRDITQEVSSRRRVRRRWEQYAA